MANDNDNNGLTITVSELGAVSVQLPSGKTVALEGLEPLGLTREKDGAPDPAFHQYETLSNVGYTKGNFSISDNLLDVPPSIRPSTLDNAFMALRHRPAPSGEFVLMDDAIEHGDVSKLPVFGHVEHYVYPEHNLLVNITQPDHLLHAGIVVRHAYETDNGQLRIATEGIGNGPLKTINELGANTLWGSVDNDIQYMLNYCGENPIAAQPDGWGRAECDDPPAKDNAMDNALQSLDGMPLNLGKGGDTMLDIDTPHVPKTQNPTVESGIPR